MGNKNVLEEKLGQEESEMVWCGAWWRKALCVELLLHSQSRDFWLEADENEIFLVQSIGHV